MSAPYETPITWSATGDLDQPFAAKMAGQRWLIRLGDFPAEPLYTLLIDGTEVESFDTWPETWTRPPG